MTLSVSKHAERLPADHFLDPQIYSKGFVNDKPVFVEIGRLLTMFHRFSSGGQDVNAHTKRHT